MKPRAFIGSSVEGLQVAYAVQQNLLHDAETTVWDQGVFELSSTTIESLNKAIGNTDFGIFVFTADDVLRMRSAEVTAVRDNVLFELGLFIGKLGRDRVFFLAPSESPPHIPSDLLGVTPAKYDSNRTDGSMQAATGAACHQMRVQIKKLGPLNPPQAAPNPPSESGKDGPEKRDWVLDFFDEKYTEAKATLEANLSLKIGEEALETQAWIHYCDFKLDDKGGLQKLLDFSSQNSTSIAAQRCTALILRLERETRRAIKLLNSLEPALRDDPTIKIAISECHVADQEPEKAIALLSGASAASDPSTAIALADIHETEGDREKALLVIHDAYINCPRNRELRYKYARLAQELEQHSVAAYFLDDLTSENPDSIDYWGYLGNSCLSLKFHDQALRAYRKAEALLKSTSGDDWIISNIANLFSNKGLSTEAIIYLERALKIDPKSEYAHDRMAAAIKKKDEELTMYKKKLAEGFRAVKETQSKRLSVAEGTVASPSQTDV
ncbi:MAG TPA: nucleotide-binding protein [Hyphomonadaceae bacterium]|nr:nucleotide-binding protein [Hyphomonadaceae bacterium]